MGDEKPGRRSAATHPLLPINHTPSTITHNPSPITKTWPGNTSELTGSGAGSARRRSRRTSCCGWGLPPGGGWRDAGRRGGTAPHAPPVCHELGADVLPAGTAPNGLNINDEVGATHPASLVELVRAGGADLGVALDGDGDRLLM